MADTEIDFGNSLLFSSAEPPAENIIESSEPHTSDPHTSDAGLEFSQSLLFPHLQTTSLSSTTTTDESNTSQTFNESGRNKVVRLLDGSTLSLQPRRKKTVSVEYGEDPDAILNMDKLYERVNKREQLRAAHNEIRASKKQNPAVAVPGSSQLWSEKHKPNSYMQICHAGNERQYRHIMKWLLKWKNHIDGGSSINDEGVDKSGRPYKKILLVHGPPGIGKTTVVHILAQKFGFAVEELNAANSMNQMQGTDLADGAGRWANTSAALKLKIKNALTTNSITSNGKPTCLIVDEIDSLVNAGDIVKVLSELVRTDNQNQRRKDGQDPKATKKTKKSPFTLHRPIICIANDIYNTSTKSWGPNPLEILRPMCDIFALKKSTVGFSHGTKINSSAQKSVKDFLMNISEKEKLQLDRREIAEVLEICDGDIRACINYLQFSSRKLDSDIHLPGNDVGDRNKDSSLTWFSLVDRIFKRNQNLSKEEDFEVMLDLVSSGDGKSAAGASIDKIIKGCFNKYLDVVHLQDDSPIRPAEISDWLYYYDLLQTRNFTSHFYPTLACLKFWSLFSDINSRKFNEMDGLIPDAKSLDYNSRDILKQNNAIVKVVADSTPINFKISLYGMSSSSSSYASEFIPFLDKMLSPDVGSAKSKISLKAHEANMIEKLASLIKTFDIKLESQRDYETNQVYLIYGPDWESLTLFDSGNQNSEQRKKSLNVKRQWLFPLLQSEIDVLSSPGLLKRQRTHVETEKKEASQKRTKMTTSVDFFKGQYDDMSTKIATAAKPVDREATRIWVKHHEGYSNAVRKNIGWLELWN